MKKTLALLLALMLLLSVTLVSCDIGNSSDETSSGDSQTTQPSGDEGEKNTSDKGGNTVGGEKCYFCLDMEGNDRKCDVCGSWVHAKGEVWTGEVPENVQVTLVDFRGNYRVIEMVGEEVYVRMWLDEEAFLAEEDCYEDYFTMTKQYYRNKKNTDNSGWVENKLAIQYGDRYELFAIQVLQYLSGSGLSDTMEAALEATDAGTEIIAGKTCTLKEYEGYFGVKYRVWLWNNMPLKKAQMDTNTETEYVVTYEVKEWDTSITAISGDKPQ